MLDRCPYCGALMRGSGKRPKHLPLTAVDLADDADTDTAEADHDDTKDGNDGI